MPKLLDDVNAALEKIRALGVQGSEQIPDKLTDAEKRQTAEAIENAERRDLHRRRGPHPAPRGGRARPEDAGGLDRRGAQSADVRFDFQLLDVNEDQEIEAPDDAKPFAELLKQFEGLGLGQLGGLGGRWRRAPNIDEYSKCVRETSATTSGPQVRRLLTTP